MERNKILSFLSVDHDDDIALLDSRFASGRFIHNPLDDQSTYRFALGCSSPTFSLTSLVGRLDAQTDPEFWAPQILGLGYPW